MILQQQLHQLSLQRQPYPAPIWGNPREMATRPGPRPIRDDTDTVVEIIDVPPAPKHPKAPAQPDAGPRLEVLRLKKHLNPYGDPKVVKDVEVEENNPLIKVSFSHLLAVTREFDRNKQYWRTSINIASPAFARLVKGIPALSAQLNPVDGDIEITEPFIGLFLSRQALNKALESKSLDGFTGEDLTQIHSHVRFVLNFMRSDFDTISRKLDNLESDKPDDEVTYPEMWMLYKPGTIVYSLENGEYEAFVVDSLRGMQKRQRVSHRNYSHGRLDLTCFSVGYDGEIFGRVWSQHSISPFHGSKNISTLNLVPEKFLPDAAKVKASLIERGKAFWALQGQQYREYTGKMYSQHTTEEASRVMVDHLTYQRRNDWPITINRKRGPSEAQGKHWRDNRFGRPCRNDDWMEVPRHRRLHNSPPPPDDVRDWSPERQGADVEYHHAYSRYKIERPAIRTEDEFKQYDAMDPKEEPDEFAALLCPQHVHGYCLRDKVWKTLNVNELRPVAFRTNAWDRLVLDAQYKNIIQAMVSSYVDNSAHLDDLVASKGQGLVALLHGPPGSGKTLTAECVADAFSKPLYQVTCGDLGTNPDQLEDRLEEIFDYAITWGAILLLDEADIFLQDRDMISLERNALVSIFLRTLDYFSGILFLTTNRVTTFDQAFQSRIHVTLGVPALDQKRRIQVWDIFVDDLAAKSAIQPAQHKLLRQLVREQWSKQRLNGRQIRNAVRTALVVAEKKGTVLGEEEVSVVLRIGREFEGYLGQGKGVMGGLEGFEEVVEP